MALQTNKLKSMTPKVVRLDNSIYKKFKNVTTLIYRKIERSIITLTHLRTEFRKPDFDAQKEAQKIQQNREKLHAKAVAYFGVRQF